VINVPQDGGIWKLISRTGMEQDSQFPRCQTFLYNHQINQRAGSVYLLSLDLQIILFRPPMNMHQICREIIETLGVIKEIRELRSFHGHPFSDYRPYVIRTRSLHYSMTMTTTGCSLPFSVSSFVGTGPFFITRDMP
jgi:hypothetical protein